MVPRFPDPGASGWAPGCGAVASPGWPAAGPGNGGRENCDPGGNGRDGAAAVPGSAGGACCPSVGGNSDVGGLWAARSPEPVAIEIASVAAASQNLLLVTKHLQAVSGNGVRYLTRSWIDKGHQRDYTAINNSGDHHERDQESQNRRHGSIPHL